MRTCVQCVLWVFPGCECVQIWGSGRRRVSSACVYVHTYVFVLIDSLLITPHLIASVVMSYPCLQEYHSSLRLVWCCIAMLRQTQGPISHLANAAFRQRLHFVALSCHLKDDRAPVLAIHVCSVCIHSPVHHSTVYCNTTQYWQDHRMKVALTTSVQTGTPRMYVHTR